MNNTKIFLGTMATNFNSLSKGDRIYIDKHSFDCGWYWGFGYIGNAHMHTHFDSVFLKGANDIKMPSELFVVPKYTDKEWWLILDLFKQAYTLKQCAEVYQYGGHYITNEHTQLIKNDELADKINSDLEKVLNKVWDILSKKIKIEK